MKIKNQQGFTLIEILVAIGLLALIMGISMQIFTANSKTLIIIWMLFKNCTIPLNESSPANNTKLLKRWNNKNTDSKRPETAI